jgi:hypothetical protein
MGVGNNDNIVACDSEVGYLKVLVSLRRSVNNVIEYELTIGVEVVNIDKAEDSVLVSIG